jgi:hypothetical protein
LGDGAWERCRREDCRRIEQQLCHAFREDIINGRFDNTGPLTGGSRLGLRAINAECRAEFIRGRDVLDFFKDDWPSNRVLDYVVIMKEAVLDFACRKELTPPSWWMGPIARAATAPTRDDAKSTKPPLTFPNGKRPRIMTYLAEHYPSGVPDPGYCPRKRLKADLLEWDPTLKPLDEATMKRAIDAHNVAVIKPST